MKPNPPPPFGPPLPPDAVERVWQRLDRRGAPTPTRRWWPWVVVAATAAAVLAVVWGWPVVAPARSLVDGSVIDEQVTLSDGSHLTPSVGASVEVVHATPELVRSRQMRGRCHYALGTATESHRWRVETPLGSVDVQAQAEFSIDVGAADRVDVDVKRGQVVVTTALRSQTVSAGERLTLKPPPVDSLETNESTRTPNEPNDPGPRVEPEHDARPPAPTAAKPVATAAQTLKFAEANVREGRTDRAVHALSDWLERSPRNDEWAILALRLGAIELDEAKDPAKALPWLEAVGRLAAPPSTLEDAAAMRVLCLRALHRDDEAATAWAAFHTRWPTSAWSIGEGPLRPKP